MIPFQASRSDGRSDRRVICDLAGLAEPDTVFTYEELEEALSDGLDVPVDRRRASHAVRSANKELLREKRRYLSVVRGRGYRVLRADEHLPVALDKKATADSYIRKGIELLRHARIDELTEAQRTLHEGQLMILGGLHQAVSASAKRHARQEQIISELSNRVERLEDAG